MQRKVDSEKEIDFQSVHLGHQDSPNLGVVCIVVVSIIKELCGQENGGNDHAVNIELRQKKVISLNETINIYQRQDKAFVGARGIFVDSASWGFSKIRS